MDTVDAVRRVRYRGGKTNTADALRVAYTQMFSQFNGDRADAQNVLVVITDGDSNNKEQVYKNI